MRTKYLLSGSLVAIILLLTNCKSSSPKEAAAKATIENAAQQKTIAENTKKLEELNKEYPIVPEDQVLEHNEAGSLVYTELKQRYKADMERLQQMVEASEAKLIFITLKSEADSSAPKGEYGLSYIQVCCRQLGIACVDFAPLLAGHNMKDMTQWEHSGRPWSKEGAAYIAAKLAPTIEQYIKVTSTAVYKDAERPETFADNMPGSDKIMDDGKGVPYHVRANAQGLRMNYNVKFPKTKKHILFMGDSGIFCPFLDNDFTITGVLQKQFPDMVMMNAGAPAYTLEDYITLWNEKARYSEPDIVFVQADGADIAAYFFANRNHFSRSHKPFTPSANEVAFYKKNYPGN